MLKTLFGSWAAAIEGPAIKVDISRSGEINKRHDLHRMDAAVVFSRAWREKDIAFEGDIE